MIWSNWIILKETIMEGMDCSPGWGAFPRKWHLTDSWGMTKRNETCTISKGAGSIWKQNSSEGRVQGKEDEKEQGKICGSEIHLRFLSLRTIGPKVGYSSCSPAKPLCTLPQPTRNPRGWLMIHIKMVPCPTASSWAQPWAAQTGSQRTGQRQS